MYRVCVCVCVCVCVGGWGWEERREGGRRDERTKGEGAKAGRTDDPQKRTVDGAIVGHFDNTSLYFPT